MFPSRLCSRRSAHRACDHQRLMRSAISPRSYRQRVCVRGLHMTPGLDRILDEPGGIGPSARRRCANPAASYLTGAAVIAASASALAITASARSMAAPSSSLRHVSTEWPSSNDRSSTPRARETSSRSAAMASESRLASAPFREDRVTCLSLLHRDHGPSRSVLTTDDYCLIGAFLVNRIPACCAAGIAADRWLAGIARRDGRIKGRDVRLGRCVRFQRLTHHIRDVRGKSAMCAITNFSNFSRKAAPRRLGGHEK